MRGFVRGSVLLVAVSAALEATTVHFREVHDDRLCNNAGSTDYRDRLCITRSLPDMEAGSEYVCDDRRLTADMCLEAVVQMDTFTSVGLLALLPTVDSDLSIRRVTIKIGSSDQLIDIIGREVDSFLTSRLWWYVDYEPYEWNASRHGHHTVRFSRVQHPFEQSLRVLAATQYPATQDICAATPLLVMHRDFRHPGWNSVLAQHGAAHDELPYAVAAMYIPSAGDDSSHGGTSFISNRDCPDVANKWECAFLPTTNCTLPSLVTECTDSTCIDERMQDTIKLVAIFDSASLTGRHLSRSALQAAIDSVERQKLHTLMLRSRSPVMPNVFLRAAVEALSRRRAPKMGYLAPRDRSHARFQFDMLASFDHYLFNFLLRPSAFYRSHVAQTIGELRKESGFQPHDRCVAAQIRRGDRIREGVNITEFCANPFNYNSDLGCSSVPFQSVTLRHVVDSAEALVDSTVRTLFVTTDDEDWLEQQRRELPKSRPDWRVLYLRGPRLDPKDRTSQTAWVREDYSYMRYGAGTASGVLLHGSIELSRQCEGFVGHFGAGGTTLVYKSMCAQHNHREHVCPPAFDLRSIKELQVRQDV